MDKLGDIELFVNVVKNKGLAAAGRKLGMSPASVTSRLNRLESGYGVRLLTRTTRKVSLTEEGAEYYQHCLKILQEVNRADESLANKTGQLQGSLKVTATVDIGKQMVAPVLAEFIFDNPGVTAHLHLVDHVVNIVEGSYDLAIRFGGLADNRMVARKLADNRRVLFASPVYLEKHGRPQHPNDLLKHKCVGMARDDLALNTWHFDHKGVKSTLQIAPMISSNDGSQVREWVIQGYGIALKSFCDIKTDIEAGRLVTLLDDYNPDYWSDRIDNTSDLYAVYPSKNYLPLRVKKFIDLLQLRFSES